MGEVDPALVRMLRAGSDKGRDLDRALDRLAQLFGRGSAARRLGPSFSCVEADIVAWVLISSGHADAAVTWLDEHAVSDDEDDTHGGDDFDAVRYCSPRGRDRVRRKR